jgi:hypothetical protein
MIWDMNPFTTDHPLNSDPSWFDAKDHPVLSFVCMVFVLALVFTPVVLLGLYHWVMSDLEGVTTPGPFSFAELGWFLLVGGVVAFVLSLVCAWPVIAVCRFWLRGWRRRTGRSNPATSSCQE